MMIFAKNSMIFTKNKSPIARGGVGQSQMYYYNKLKQNICQDYFTSINLPIKLMPNPSTKLTSEEIQFLESLGLGANSSDLKNQIQSLIQSQTVEQNSTLPKKSNNNLSQTLTKLYTEIIPELERQGKTWDIDYDFDRKENKRYEVLKKRGCSEVIKVEV